MNSFLPVEIIKKKRNGQELSESEIEFFIKSYTNESIPDYQMSALLMAIFFKGMSDSETLFLTKAMISSGIVFNHSTLKTKVDKHSTGGVGDKTSLVIGPVVAACGVAVPMISGRGLGHTGGTLDKLESIPGFNTQLKKEKFSEMIDDLGISFIGQTQEICPADKKIYALRDVTGTVESFPLICASIMSKKLAEGIDGLVLDVKFGSGAFIKNIEESKKLAHQLKTIGTSYGKKVIAVLSNMNQPLGLYAGNSLEVLECVEILKGKRDPAFEDTRELSLHLSSHMILLGNKATSFEEAYKLAENTLLDGTAFNIFSAMIAEQGGNLEKLPIEAPSQKITSLVSGYISEIDTEKIGMLGIKIKMGRGKVSDVISPAAGFKFYKKIGDSVNVGESLIDIFGDTSLTQAIAEETRGCFKFSDQKTNKIKLIDSII